MGLAVGEEIPAPVTARVVPGLRRSTIEEACYEIIRRRRLSQGHNQLSVKEVLAGGDRPVRLCPR
jgi:hypothetical protein